MSKAKQDVSDLPNEFLVCRDMGHAWAGIKYIERVTYQRSTYVTRSVECMRCHVDRRDLVSTATWQTVRRSYVYPEGYRLLGSKPWAVSRQARKELFGRLGDSLVVRSAETLNPREGDYT